MGSWREHGTGVSVDVHVRPTRCRYLDELVSSSIASSQRYLLDQTSRKISHTRGMRFHGSHAEYDAIRRHRSLSFATRGGSIDAPTRREAFTGFSTLSRAPAQPPDPLGKQHKRLSKHPDARRDATNSRSDEYASRHDSSHQSTPQTVPEKPRTERLGVHVELVFTRPRLLTIFRVSFSRILETELVNNFLELVNNVRPRTRARVGTSFDQQTKLPSAS